ncbi:MAG: hypothetical protein RR203_07695 [Synergistaceae bacterium]
MNNFHVERDSFMNNINTREFFILITLVLCFIVVFFFFNSYLFIKIVYFDKPLNPMQSRNLSMKQKNDIETLVQKHAHYDKYLNESCINAKYAQMLSANVIEQNNKDSVKDIQVPDFIPNITIMGLIVVGNKSIAKLNIENEFDSKFYQKGDPFASGKGKILEIDSKGVTWSWKNRKQRTNL